MVWKRENLYFRNLHGAVMMLQKWQNRSTYIVGKY